jgi:N-acetylmuramoyl-L-alanine amidase
VGVTGILEKDLNLEIATALGGRLAAAGVRVVYTRTEDKLLYTDEQNVRGQRKMWDLKNRLLVAEKEETAILVSIHMNKYPSAGVSGLLTYYAKGPESRALALGIQSKVAADFPDMKRRVPKEAGDNIYLLAHAPCPAVLVECGFLSNPEECEKLSQKDYQSRLSFSLFCAMMEYIEKI